jgi:hypothetical protein
MGSVIELWKAENKGSVKEEVIDCGFPILDFGFVSARSGATLIRERC